MNSASPVGVRLSIVIVAFAASAWGGSVAGWRGDGSGVYPEADPPLRWHQISTAIAGLRFQTEPPTSGQAEGTPMPDGVVREWLVLGPIAAVKNGKGRTTDPLLVEDQSKLQPAPGQAVGDTAWKTVKAETAYLDFARQFDTYGKKVDRAAYASVYIYCPAEAGFIVRTMHTGALTLWVNGKCTHKFSETELNYTPQATTFTKGWNRLLIRSTPTSGQPPIQGTWYVNLVLQADPAAAQYQQQNIPWKTVLPAGEGFGSPITVGGKVFLTSEVADLVCIDAVTGKLLWVRSNNYNDLATDEERKANPEVFKQVDPLADRLAQFNAALCGPNPPKPDTEDGRVTYKEKVDLQNKLYALMKKVGDRKYAMPHGQDVGYAGFTPVSDGKRVWAWFATGVSCCYDVDGKLIWRRMDNEGSFFEHGYSSSPILADGKLIVFMKKMLAFDAARGDRLWATELEPKGAWADRFHGTPAAAKVGQSPVCILPTGVVLRLSDGVAIRAKGPEVANLQQEMPSPVVVGSTVYRLSTYGRFLKYELPAEVADVLQVGPPRELKTDLSRYPTNYLEWHMASPLIHEGLAYLVNNTGVLTVVDVETMKVVYEKLLDVGHFQTAHEGAGRGIGISPVLAGGRIYLIGTDGTTVVIKPGRAYEPLARNRIESVFYRYYGIRHERFVANPAFEGRRMFLRGERYLYCLSAP